MTLTLLLSLLVLTLLPLPCPTGEARRAVLEMTVTYEGGLTRPLAEELQVKLEKSQRELEEVNRETGMYCRAVVLSRLWAM